MFPRSPLTVPIVDNSTLSLEASKPDDPFSAQCEASGSSVDRVLRKPSTEKQCRIAQRARRLRIRRRRYCRLRDERARGSIHAMHGCQCEFQIIGGLTMDDPTSQYQWTGVYLMCLTANIGQAHRANRPLCAVCVQQKLPVVRLIYLALFF
jgi:hypothetical protein